MPKLAPLDDENTYYKYAYEARTRAEELERASRMAKLKTKGLAGKAGAMGDSLGFYTTNPAQPDGENNLKAGDAAYDATQNIRESMADDARVSERAAIKKINQRNGNESRAAVEQRRWEMAQVKRKK